MSSCTCAGFDRAFGPRRVAREVRSFERRGPAETTNLLSAALRRHGVEGSTLLDIGGGLGALQCALLEAGVSRAAHVEASAAFTDAAREIGGRRGWGGLIDYYVGDFVELAEELGDFDIVTLDRVVCCYRDMEPLLRRSAKRARRLYALSYPIDAWWVRAVFQIQNLGRRLIRNAFRTYVHSPAEIEAILKDAGLRRRDHVRSGVWRVAVYGRG